MEKTIKQITLDDYGKLAVVFTEEEVKMFGIVNKDNIYLEDLIFQHGI